MDRLADHSLSEQTPQRQFEVLQSLERDDDVTVVLEEKGGLSGPVTSVVENGPEDAPEEVHVQFLDYESDYRHDDQPHHTVSVTRTEDGDWEQAELTYSWTDTGRVRRKTVDDVERIWHGFSTLRRVTTLSRDEAAVVSMKQSGLTNAEIADQWGCDERTITALFADVKNKYRQARRTVDELEATSIDLDGRMVTWRKSYLGETDSDGTDADGADADGADTDGADWRPDWEEIGERYEETDSE